MTAARCDYPVLIIGETGSGKELVARSIHQASSRSERDVVVADCAAAVDSLLEPELFGHARGAFTGAHASRNGLVSRADRSTLFLDEVDSMSARMQKALLRVLETGEYRPVGSSSVRHSDFRLVSAALPRLEDRVSEGQFREDLFYRLGTLRIWLPPLRERDGDAVEIATDYLGRRGLSLSSGAARFVAEFSWPGNVRQLRHALDVAALSGERCLDRAAIASAVGNNRPTVPRSVEREAWEAAKPCLPIRSGFASRQFAEIAGVSRRSAQRYLARLVRLGVLKRDGAGRTTVYWQDKAPM